MENKRTVASWQENGMLYTLTASPIHELIVEEPILEQTNTGHSSEMISVYQYLGNRTPDSGTGAKIYQHAKNSGAKYEAAELNTPYYQGKIMLYERGFLDVYFNKNTTVISSAEDDGDLPF
jgi:hypothetical protein